MQENMECRSYIAELLFSDAGRIQWSTQKDVGRISNNKEAVSLGSGNEAERGCIRKAIWEALNSDLFRSVWLEL